MIDILVQNGQVIDGSGAPSFRADVAVQAGRIVEVGRFDPMSAETVLEASGCTITPGFVDMHSHTDFTLPILPTADSLVHQGITTAVVGQCGSSPAPLLEETRDQVVEARRQKDRPLPWEEWSTFASYVDYLEGIGTSINVVPLVGQGTVRASVMGFTAEAANEAQMARMQKEVMQAMEEGAIGISTGLIYPPGSYASTDELITLIGPVGKRDGFYFSHIRGEGDTLLEAVSEAIRIGRETGSAVQISHFKAVGADNWYKSGLALELIDAARGDGLDVSADLYPYLASSTGLSAALPQWALEGGKEKTLARLQDPDTRRKMKEEMVTKGYASSAEWDKVIISSSPNARAFQGRTVAELAAEAGKTTHDWVFDALLSCELDIGMVKFGMSEENRKAELRHPALMIGTDGSALAPEGPLSQGVPHPRSYGTFPRVLGHYVREQEVLALETAIWKMTGLPAQKLRWSDRGLVKRGYAADLVVLEPDTVTDCATYQAPHQFPRGIRHVIVNGELVIHEEKHTHARPGNVLRRQ
jgi:N-acyl-D-amino-acid deacylase